MVQPPRRGEIWFGFTPGQPRDPHQPRPVLVVSEDIRNRHRDDVVVVPIFSRGRPGPTRVALSEGAAGIPRASILFCEQITTLYRDFLVDGPLGEPVSRSVFEAVLRAVRRALGEVVPEPDDGW
ncbi:MAG TPA: type II toxin-antitoxin system PemK/MazF family toxin [Chloroflexota bacterium]|nr:type II toxin-antitoxin system PemK/MazF family toxin [Chloroflexota bacterium]